MKDIYQHRRHNKNFLMAHIILVTKYRKKLFFGSFRNDVKQYIYDTCVKHHRYVKPMETDKDHIHILLQYDPTDCITDIIRTLKQYSTYYAWKYHGDILKQHYWKNRILWLDGYFAASIGQVSQTTIEHYIENHG